MISDERSVRLRSEGLLSKWGFNDGDSPDDWHDYCEARGIEYPGWPLAALVREFLLPRLNQQVTVTEIDTIHNPIRAQTVDGRDVTGLWYDSHDDLDGILTPEYVGIPMSEVVRVALELTSPTHHQGAGQ